MSRFFNPRLTSLEAYTPGEQPRDRTYIKLNTNESPYPPSRGVRRAMDRQALDDLRLYCDPNATVLKEKLAKLYDKEPSQIFVANGSDDILNFAFLAFGAEGVLFPLIVEEGCIFVLGDNRAVSKDSRHPEIGLIDKREVLGKALVLMVPGVDEFTEKRDFDRTGAIR